jgi:alkanesulfonate monooxygenase SsuD/methylene tetrahydromethanopterin reductase-like flavin-dependent oxidoreductase (luciferase family)
VGCLLFCTPFRNPALLARAAVTIDHISGGRAELGMGAGWRQEEFDDHGWVFGTLGERMAALEEALQVVRRLLDGETVTLRGKHHTYAGAVCRPRPVQERLPIWVGGTGPRRTPRLAARYADGLNVPFLSPEETRKRFEALERACEEAGRDPAQVRRTVNVEFHMGADAAAAERIRRRLADEGHARGAGSLLGTAQEAVERIGEYALAGAECVNIAIRPPLDWEAFDAFISEVMPRFA